ncbi:MAG: bifunctional riboflavin kinase/FAD synthetase [Flammeovirgaceae bacterium]
MRVITDNSSINDSGYNIATIGYFDGIHLGHKKILNELVGQAQKKNGKSILITFWPHPRNILNPNTSVELLLSNDDKHKLIEVIGIDYLYIIKFTKEFSKMSAHSFIQNFIVDKLNVSKLIIGYNHSFGHKREGNFLFLQKNNSKYNFEIQEVKKKEINDKLNISSSIIRDKVRDGKLDLANQMLGYKYYITGQVVKGDGIGKKINYPTANIMPENNSKLIPGNGVYVCKVNIENKNYQGMLNIGKRPTVNGKERRIELHIFDFNTNIYGKNVKITLIKKIRDEIKFNNLDQLKHQLQKDEIKSLNTLNNEKI